MMIATLTALSLLAAPMARPPAPEQPPALLSLTAQDCEEPARRTKLLRTAEAGMAEVRAYGEALNAHSAALMEWRGEQLVAAGRWTEDDKTRFATEMLSDPTFMTEVEAGMAMATDVIEPAMRAGDESRPELERCHGLVEMHAVFARIMDSVRRQWGIVERLYAAEAQRLGVSLD